MLQGSLLNWCVHEHVHACMGMGVCAWACTHGEWGMLQGSLLNWCVHATYAYAICHTHAHMRRSLLETADWTPPVTYLVTYLVT